MEIDGRPIKDRMPPIHPGESLADDLEAIGMLPEEFDRALSIPPGTTAAILAGRRNIDAELALRLSHYFGTTALIWMDLQVIHDLKVTEREVGPKILKEVQPRPGIPTEIPVAEELQ